MPPKPKPGGPSKKNVEKKKEKLIEDKTFGLKNKKGTKQQTFIKNVTTNVKGGKTDKEKADERKKKELAKNDELELLNSLFKPVIAMPKISKDVDPKSVVCVFFKQGLCTKGEKCKFSHDLSIERRTEKKNVYVDMRDDEDNMDNWDEAKLEEVISKKHSEKNKLKPQTAIICRYFLEALENSKYGWFWDCPNGDTCIYRHALPPGYMLNKDKKKLEEQKDDAISLEDLVEKERAALSSKQALTKVTLESFLAWKKRKIQEKKKKAKDNESKKMSEFKAGKQTGLSGKDLFTFNPDLILQDDDDADDIRYVQERDENEDEEEKAYEIDDSMFKMEGQDDVDEEGATGGDDPGAFNEALFDADGLDELDDDELDDPSFKIDVHEMHINSPS